MIHADFDKGDRDVVIKIFASREEAEGYACGERDFGSRAPTGVSVRIYPRGVKVGGCKVIVWCLVTITRKGEPTR